LAEIGLQPERLEMFNLSSAEGTRFAEIARTMVERIKRLGPSPLRPDSKRIEQGVEEMSRRAEAMLAGVAAHESALYAFIGGGREAPICDINEARGIAEQGGPLAGMIRDFQAVKGKKVSS